MNTVGIGGAPKTALVIGEALIDIVARDDEAREFVGGGPLNIAVGLARLGHPTRLLAHIAHDERGERIAAHLDADGVSLHPGSWSAARTPTAHASIGDAGAATYRFDIAWRVPGLGAPGAELVHSGSIALFLEPGGSDVLSYLRGLPDSTAVTLDPNIRPALIADHAAAVERFEVAAERADLIKMSDEDAEWLYPGRPVEEVAGRLLGSDPGRGRPRIVVVTLGADGAYARSHGTEARVAALPVTVVDTISAGDSFMASLASSLLERGLDGVLAALPAVLDRAARAAAIAVSAPGANPPTRDALDSAAPEA